MSLTRRTIGKPYSAFQINHPPPLDPGGGWQPSVIRQRGGVGLLNVHLCAWGWGWRASVMQHPGGVGGFGWSSWSGGGVGKTCQGGVGAVASERGGGALAPMKHVCCLVAFSN